MGQQLPAARGGWKRGAKKGTGRRGKGKEEVFLEKKFTKIKTDD